MGWMGSDEQWLSRIPWVGVRWVGHVSKCLERVGIFRFETEDVLFKALASFHPESRSYYRPGTNLEYRVPLTAPGAAISSQRREKGKARLRRGNWDEKKSRAPLTKTSSHVTKCKTVFANQQHVLLAFFFFNCKETSRDLNFS